jgi:hypothetical protein
MRTYKDGITKADILPIIEQTRKDLDTLETSAHELIGLMVFKGVQYSDIPKGDVWGKNLVDTLTYVRYISHRLYNLENYLADLE